MIAPDARDGSDLCIDLGSGLSFGTGRCRRLGDADHCRPQQAVADQIALLHHLNDRAGRILIVLHLEYGLMEVVIELFTFGIDPLNAMALDRRGKLALRHGDAVQ